MSRCYKCCKHFTKGANFCDIEVNRTPQMDKYYTEGKREMDWFNANDRIAIVKELGFYCSEDTFSVEECEECAAKEYCDRYEEFLDFEYKDV